MVNDERDFNSLKQKDIYDAVGGGAHQSIRIWPVAGSHKMVRIMQRMGHALETYNLESGLLFPAIAQFDSLLQTFGKNISEDQVSCSSDMIVSTCWRA